jgi:flagellum-specific peptidoglycan hydrolase FlgJ
MLKKFLIILMGLFVFVTSASMGNHLKEVLDTEKESELMVLTEQLKQKVSELEEQKRLLEKEDSIFFLKNLLIEEVHNYITSVAPRTRMSATNIVNQCLSEEYDITLLLSQGHLETHFGTSGRNVFGLYGKRYSHPDSAVSDYISLMKRKFIINRTTEQLLAENVNWEHNRRVRYAGNPNYGRQLTQIRNNMLRTTEIKTLSDSISKLIMSRDTEV